MPKTITNTLTTSAQDLKSAISVGKSFVPARPTHPILSCFLIELGDTVSLTAFDLANSIKINLKGVYEGDAKTVCVSADLFSNAVGCLKANTTVTIEVKDTTLLIKSGKTKITISYQSADNYPALPSITTDPFDIPANLLSDIIKLSDFVSKEDTKAIACVSIEISGGTAEGYATNEYQLVWFKQEADQNIDFKALIPGKSLKLLDRLISDEGFVTLAVDGLQIAVLGSGWTFTTRQSDLPYPPVKRLIPAQFSIECGLQSQEFIEALQACTVVDPDNLFRADVSEPGLRVYRSKPDTGEVDQVIDAEVQGEITFSSNSNHFISVLKLLKSEKVRLFINTAVSPIVVKAVESDTVFEGLVMPCQIRQ